MLRVKDPYRPLYGSLTKQRNILYSYKLIIVIKYVGEWAVAVDTIFIS